MISFASPAREHQALAEPIEEAVLRVLRSGAYVLGEEVSKFEHELAQFVGCSQAVAVSSGTDALVCALHALGIGPGDRVVVPAFGFISAPEAVVRVGASPVFVDIEPHCLGPDPSRLAEPQYASCKALIVMHLFGQALDVQPLQALLPEAAIIEDAAQAIGSRVGNQHVGTASAIGTLSFFPAKSLGTAGSGGAVLTSDPALAQRARQARVHGASGAYNWAEPGGNYRLDTLQAAILRVKLTVLEARLARRKSIGSRLAGLASTLGAQVFTGPSHSEPTYAPLALRLSERDRVHARLRELGVDARVQYPVTLPSCPVFRPFVDPSQRFAQAELATQQLISVPCYPELTDQEVCQLETALGQAMRNA